MGYVNNPYVESTLNAMEKKQIGLEELNEDKWLEGMFNNILEFKTWNWIKRNKRLIMEIILVILMLILGTLILVFG